MTGAKNFNTIGPLESLQEYVLIAQDKCRVEHHLRHSANEWTLTETSNLQAVIQLPSIHCQLALADIYDQVELSAE